MIDSWRNSSASMAIAQVLLLFVFLQYPLLLAYSNSQSQQFTDLLYQHQQQQQSISPFINTLPEINNHIYNYHVEHGEGALTEYLAPDSHGQLDDFETYAHKHRLSPLSMEKHRILTRNSFMHKNRIYGQEHMSHIKAVEEKTKQSEIMTASVVDDSHGNTVSQRINYNSTTDDLEVGTYSAEAKAERHKATALLNEMKNEAKLLWDSVMQDLPKDAGAHRYGVLDEDIFGLHARYTFDTMKVTLGNNFLDTMLPTSQPTGQPSRQPSGSPTSRPTESYKNPFKVYLDKLEDGLYPTAKGSCPFIHNDGSYFASDSGTYIDISTDEVVGVGSGVCNYRTAVRYCLEEPNYDSGLVSECIIVWPRNSKSKIDYGDKKDEIVWDFRINTPDSVLGLISKYPVNIIFDGRGSTVVGNNRFHFITTNPGNDTNYNISNNIIGYEQFKVESDFRRLFEIENGLFDPEFIHFNQKKIFEGGLKETEGLVRDGFEELDLDLEEDVKGLRDFLYRNANEKDNDSPIISEKSKEDVSLTDIRLDRRFKNLYKVGSNFDLQSGKSGLWAKMTQSTMTFRDITLERFGFPASNGGCLKLVGVLGVVLDNANLYNCSGVLGGGMFIQWAYSVDIINSSITQMKSLCGGGAFINNTKYIRIYNSEISNNYAKNIGGGLAIDRTGNLTIADSVFDNNLAYMSWGGALSIVNVLGAYAYISRSNFTNNEARYGSAISMAGNKCNTLLCSNHFAHNTVKQSGTIYWLHVSAMDPPVIPVTRRSTENNTAGVCYNSFQKNVVPYQGFDITTEPLELVPSPPVSLVRNYTSSALPVDIRVDLFDFYKHNAKAAKGTSVQIYKERRDDCNCHYNTDNCLIVENLTNAIDQGRARFSRTKFSCIPSDWKLELERLNRTKYLAIYTAYMDPTFSVEWRNEAFDYPRYMRDLNKTISDKKAIKAKARLYFRTCVDGEKYDYFTSTRSTCSICKNEYLFQFISNTQTRACLPCPKPVKYCIGKDLILYSGTYRWTNRSTRIYECPLIGGCLGGVVTGVDSCGDRFEGPWCGLCKEGYYQSRQTGSCESCSASQKFSLEDLMFIAILSLALLIPSITFIVKKYNLRISDEDKDVKDILKLCGLQVELDSTEAELIKDMIAQSKSIKDARTESWISRLKITVVTYQIICQSPQTLQIDFPESMSSLIDSLGAINLDFMRIIPISCYQGLHFLEKMRIMTVLPFVFACFLIVLYFFRLFGLFLSDRNKLSRKQRESGFRIGYFEIFLIFLYLLIPSLSTMIFETFDCIEVDPLNESIYHGQIFLRTDFFINCKTKEYSDGWYYALGMVVVYPCCTPLFFFLLLYICRHEILARVALEKVRQAAMIRDGRDPVTLRTKLRLNYRRLSSALSFLYVAYEPKFWYWDFIEVTRRLVLTSFLSIIFAGTVAQVTVSVALSLIYIKVYNFYKPYLLNSEDALSELCQYQIFITLFGASMFLQRSLGASESLYVQLDYLLVVCNLSAIFLNIYYIYVDIVDSIGVHRQLRDKNAILTAISVGNTKQVVHSKYMAIDENLEEKKRMDALALTQKEPIKLVKEKWKTKFDMTQKDDVKLFMEIVNNMSDDDVFRMQAMIFENIIKYERRCEDKIWIYCQDPIIIGTFADVKSGRAKENALIYSMPLRVAQLGVEYEATKEDISNPRIPVPKYVSDLIAMDVGFSGELFRPKRDINREHDEAKQNLDDSKGAEEYDDNNEFDEQEQDNFKNIKGDDEESDGYYDEQGDLIERKEETHRDEEQHNDSDEDDIVAYKQFIAQKREELRKEKNYFDLDNDNDDNDGIEQKIAEPMRPRQGGIDIRDTDRKKESSNFNATTNTMTSIHNNGNNDNDFANSNNPGHDHQPRRESDLWRGDDDEDEDEDRNLFDDLSEDEEVIVRKGGRSNATNPAATIVNVSKRVGGDGELDEFATLNDDNSTIRIKSNKLSRPELLRRESNISVGSSVSEFEMGDTSQMKRNLLKKQRLVRGSGGKDIDSSDFYESDQSVGGGFNRPRGSDVEDLDGETESGMSTQGGKFNAKFGARLGNEFTRNIIPIEESGSEDSSLPKSTKAASLLNANIIGKKGGRSEGGSVEAHSDRGGIANSNVDFDSDFGPRGYINSRHEYDDDHDEDTRDQYKVTTRFLDKSLNKAAVSIAGTSTFVTTSTAAPPVVKGQVNAWGEGLDVKGNDNVKNNNLTNQPPQQPPVSYNSSNSKVTKVNIRISDDERNLVSDFSTDGEIHILKDYDQDDIDDANRHDDDGDDDDYDDRLASKYNKSFLKNAFEDDIDVGIDLGKKSSSPRGSVIASSSNKGGGGVGGTGGGTGKNRPSFRK